MLRWLRGGLGESHGGSAGAVFSVLDMIYNPGGARARDLLEEHHEHVVAKPTPGDKLLADGCVVVRLKQRDARTGEPTEPAEPVESSQPVEPVEPDQAS
jgi:hypothetical protein